VLRLIDVSNGGPFDTSNAEIDIPASIGTIALTSGSLSYDGGNAGGNTMAVKGTGGVVTISQSGGATVITSSSSDALTVENLAITGSFAVGVFSDEGAIVASGVSVAGATDEGIWAHGSTVSLTDSEVLNSTNTGVESFGDISLVRSTVAGNGRYGIDTNTHGDASLVDSTVSGNAQDSTFDGINAVSVTLVYSTVVQNGTAAISDVNIRASADLTSFGSVVALKGATANCSIQGTTTSNGYNLSDDASCGFTGTGDRQGAANDPMLAALADNGGGTQTRSPLTGSPLLDAIPTASCQADGAAGVTTDQRGITRPQGATCDIGAVEIEVVPLAPVIPPAPGVPPVPVVIQPLFTG
jgi:hypothetical protein